MSQTKPTSLSFSPQMASSSNVLLSPFARIQDVEYLYALNTNVSSFVSVKLSGSGNYLLWEAQMICLLDSKNMRGTVDATFVGPRDYGTGITRRYDSLVKGWIFGSVIEDVLVDVFNLGSAKAVWEKLKSIYDPTVSLQQGITARQSCESRRSLDGVSLRIQMRSTDFVTVSEELERSALDSWLSSIVGHIKKMEWSILHMRFPDNLWDEIDKLDYSDTYRPCYTRPQSYCQRFLKLEQSMKNTAESCSITAALITAIVFAIGITVSTHNVSNKEMWTPLFEKRIAMIILFISDAISLFASGTALLVFLSILTSCFAEKDFLLSLPRRMFIGLLSLLLSTTTMMVAFTATLFLVFCDEKLWMLAPICGLAFIPIAVIVGLQLPLVVDLFTSTYLHIFGKQRKHHVLRDFKSSKNLHEASIKVHWSEVESMLKNVQGVASKPINSDGCNVLQLATEIGKEMWHSINSILTSSARIQDTEYLYASTTNVSSFVSVKLSGSNNNINKCGIVDSTLVRGQTFGSVTENVPAEVFNISSTKADWEKLKSICDPSPRLQNVGYKKEEWLIVPIRFPDNLCDHIDMLEQKKKIVKKILFRSPGAIQRRVKCGYEIIRLAIIHRSEDTQNSENKTSDTPTKEDNNGYYDSFKDDNGDDLDGDPDANHQLNSCITPSANLTLLHPLERYWDIKASLKYHQRVLGALVVDERRTPQLMCLGGSNSKAEEIFLGRHSHPNLVKLLGYCYEDDELLRVYEFMHRGSLENHLFGRGLTIQPLPWDIRIKTAIGAAQGLEFLHTSDQKVIYRDFKASNILLDGSYNSKLSDFGLAKLASASQSHVTTRVMGTYGYVAPEYMTTGHLYVKSDVYCFGIVLVEMLTALRALDEDSPANQRNLVKWSEVELILQEEEELDLSGNNKYMVAIVGKKHAAELSVFPPHTILCNTWAAIAAVQFPGRTDNEIKNLEKPNHFILQLVIPLELPQSISKSQLGFERQIVEQDTIVYRTANLKLLGPQEETVGHIKKRKDGKTAKKVLEMVCDEIDKLDYSVTHHPYQTRPILKVACQNADQDVHEILITSHEPIDVEEAVTELEKVQRQRRTEVDFLGKIEHQNLVKQSGYCFEEDMLGSNWIMVYEYMSNRSLDYHLLGKSNTPLSWLVRLNIARDAAVGLTYLHEEMGSNSQIIFRDLKPSNVLLDENWNAKLSECGCVREGPQDGWSHVLTLGLKKFVEPTYLIKENIFKETPHMVFKREHESLLKEEERWMKITTNLLQVHAKRNSDGSTLCYTLQSLLEECSKAPC